MYCEFGRSFNEHTKRSETERGSDVESQMSEVGKRLRSENRWELLQEKRTDMKLYFLERGIPIDLSIIKFVKILRIRLQQKLSWKIHSFYLFFGFWVWGDVILKQNNNNKFTQIMNKSTLNTVQTDL